MVKFFFTYLIVGGLLAAGIWYSMPTAKHKVYERLYQPRQDLASTQYIEYIAPSGEKKTITFASASTRTATGTQETSDQGDSAATASTETTSTTSRPTTVAARPAPPFVPSWGVVRDTTNSFTTAGTLFEKLKGGTVIERLSRHESDAGAMIKTRVLKADGQWVSDIFVPERSIVVFDGDFANASATERDAILKYFTLRNQIAERRATFREEAIRRNPHFADYRKAAMAMLDLQKQAQELTVKRDAATDSQRHTYNEQLRHIKYEEPKLSNNLAQIEAKYKAWRDANDDGSKAAANDAQLKTWMAALGDMEASIRPKAVGNW